jgi:orotate phosphoribosyltransferase
VASHALCDWRAVLAVASERGMFDARAVAEVQRFLQNPAGWSQAHGGIAAPPADRSPI